MKIAIISPGDRTDRITVPFDSIGLDYELNPDKLRKYPVIICDTPDRHMFKAQVKNEILGNTLLYRMRGDPIFAIKEWVDKGVKRKVIHKYMLPRVDGCIPITPHQTDLYNEHTGVECKEVPLPKDPSNWDSCRHTDSELRIVTLTNATYWPKIQPLFEIGELVNDFLSIAGGYWKIGSWNDGYLQYLKTNLGRLDNIEVVHQMDAHEELSKANCMIHYSNFDAYPNAILEGHASRLPVLVNDYEAFTWHNSPVMINKTLTELHRNLHRLRKPELREHYGQKGIEYVKEKHSPEYVGKRFKEAIEYFYGEEIGA